MINRLSWSLLFLCLCFSANLLADESTDQPFFKVSPIVCVTDTKQKVCEFNIQVHFRLAPFKELCLEVTQRPQYTQCYTQNGLINPINNEVVQQQLLSIANYEAKDYRIKRRFGWSL